MIRKVSIRNFKCLRDVQIDLERFTVFVGPNASGKSSILQGLNLLCQTFRMDHSQTLEGEIQQNLSRGTSDPIELAGESDGKWYRYHTRSTSPRDGRGVAASLAATDWRPWKTEPPGSAPLPLSVLVHLETSKLLQPNSASSFPGVKTPDDPTVMAPDGTGLHSALANMALNDPDSWQALQANLRRIIPTIRRLRHTPAKLNQHAALLFDTVGGDSLPAAQVSEGTLLVLGMLAALYAPSRPSLALIDDLDRGLHPKAQKELISLLRGLLDTNPGLQIIATTHSPYLLDSMGTNEVRMTILREDGATACAPLTAHPKFEKWKDEMTPGEMWSLFGEKWLVEQEATA